MFGYVRAFKPYMRICEFDTYKAVYCGLCKTMGREFGLASRFTLSYDFAFLTLMNMSVNGVKITAERERCIAHPLKRSPCATCKSGLDYPAYAAVILVYHKLRDDLGDRGFKGKLAAAVTLPFFRKPYKKAKTKYGSLANTIEEMMGLQKKIETEKHASVDLACEPTAKMMEAIAAQISDEDEKRSVLKRFGYLLGRYIYLCDALDDVKDDLRKGGYNPLLSAAEIPKDRKELSDEEYERICKITADSINFTLGELAEAYVKLDIELYKPILDNIIYLGLKNVFEQVRSGKFLRKNKE